MEPEGAELLTTLSPSQLKKELAAHLPFWRIKTREVLPPLVQKHLKVTNERALAVIADILLSKQLGKEEVTAQIIDILEGRSMNKILIDARRSEEPVSLADAASEKPKELKKPTTYKVAILFETQSGYLQFSQWHNHIRENHQKDLVRQGFLGALQEQIKRKLDSKAPLFSKLVMKEPKRPERDLLLPNDFEVEYLPRDISVNYYVKEKKVTEQEFPTSNLNFDMIEIVIETDFKPNESTYCRARTHNFVRYLAYHSQILHEIPPVDPDVLRKALDDLINVKQMIGIQSLVEAMKTDLQLFSHPTGSPRGVLLWGPPGTGKTYLISTLLSYLGIAAVSDPLAAGDFLKGIVGESELMINELAKRAKAVPWMLTAISIDEIDGLAPSRNGPSSSGSSVNKISVLLSVIGGNKDTPNLVLFGATNLYESMDEAFLRRMNIKLFVGRPSALARKEWIEKKLLRNKKIVLQGESHNRYLSQISKITVNFSNDAMRVFINYMETFIGNQTCVVTKENYEKFWQDTLKKAKSVCSAERVVIANMYLPNLVEAWQTYDKIASYGRYPSHESFLAYASANGIRKRYFKELPRIFLDMNAESGQIQIKESRGEEDLTELLEFLDKDPWAITYGFVREKLTEMAKVDKELDTIISDILNHIGSLDYLLTLANTYLTKNDRLIDKKALNDIITEIPDFQYLKALQNIWEVATGPAFKLKPGDETYNPTSQSRSRFIDVLLATDEAEEFRRAVKKLIGAAKRIFTRESKIKTFSITKHIDAAEFDHEEARYLLFQFVVHGDFGCFHYIDASYLYRKGITEENMAIKHIAAIIEEASQYPSAMVAIDLDSISQVHKELSGLKKEMKTPHTDLSAGPSISYHAQKSTLMNMVIELAKSNTPVWLAIICKHPYLTNKFKETLDWWTEEERAQQDEADQQDQERNINKKCKYCHEQFTEAANNPNSCGRHRWPDLLYIDEHYEEGQEKKLRRFTMREAEDMIDQNNIPRNRVHYFCCGRSIDDRGEFPDKHVGDPIP